MSEKNVITVVTVCDNHYISLLAALIKSIEVNHYTEELISIYIVDDGISLKNRKKLQQSINPTVVTLIWVNMDGVIPDNVNLPDDKSFYPVNIYMRLFIPYFIPKEIEKALYLDVDMIMLGDISELWKIDIENYPLGAVVDPRAKTFNSWAGIKNYKELGLDGNLPYFNTGLLLINTHVCRKLDLANKVLLCVKSNKPFLNYPDQYGLNVVLANDWKAIDPRWNVFSDTLSEQEPYLIHFTGRKPIYKSYNYNPEFKKLFFDYLNKTAWHHTTPVNEFSRYVKILLNKLEKIALYK